MRDAVQHRATMVAEGGRQVAENLPFVMRGHGVRISTFICSRTGEGHVLVASFVNNETAYLTLVALLPETPNKILAVAAEGGLLEESRHEAVILDHVNVLLFQSTLATSEFFSEGRTRVARSQRILENVTVLFRHREIGSFLYLSIIVFLLLFEISSAPCLFPSLICFLLPLENIVGLILTHRCSHPCACARARSYYARMYFTAML